MGKLILVIGPSGSGKGTLIEHVRPMFPGIAYPRSCTTRAKRGGASDENYYFLSKDEFMAKVKRGDFLEWAEYGGNLYGTLKSEVEPLLKDDMVALKELEVQGARQVREKLGKDELTIIFVNAGGWVEMEERIRKRADMPESEIAKRKERYEDEVGFIHEADYVVDNPLGKVDEAKKKFAGIIGGIVSRG